MLVLWSLICSQANHSPEFECGRRATAPGGAARRWSFPRVGGLGPPERSCTALGGGLRASSLPVGRGCTLAARTQAAAGDVAGGRRKVRWALCGHGIYLHRLQDLLFILALI